MVKHSLVPLCLLLAVVGTLPPITLQAQTTALKVDSIKEDGLKVTKFETPYGNLVVNLPDDMSDSDTLSGTVIAEPVGDTDEEKKSNSDTLEGYVIEVVPKNAPEKKTSCKPNLDYTPFCLTIPNICGAVDVIVTRRVSAVEHVPQPVATCSVPCLPKPPAMCVPPNKAILPTKASCGKPMVIKGKCDGKFTNSAVIVSKKKCPMLAESPRQQVAQSPKDLTGKLEIESIEGPRKICGTFINMPIAMACPPVKEAKMANDVQYMTMRTPSAPSANKIDLSGNWVIVAKNDYGSQDVPTTLTHAGDQVTWGAAGEGWSVSYRGILTGNSLDTTQVDNGGKFTGHGVLSYDPNADTLSGTLTFVFVNGPQGVTTDIIMHRASR